MSRSSSFDAAFTEAYEALNPEQRQAVDAIEGPVMVIAGPGTGKTQILTVRIANILRVTDTQPEQILALTFTESGAAAMRDRLRRYVGNAAFRVPIHTFHGFCQQLIAQHPDAYARIIGGRAISDVERLELIEEILDGGKYTALRPIGNPVFNVKPIIGALSDLKRENISPDALAALVNGEAESLDAMERYHQKGAHKGKERGDYSKAARRLKKMYELLALYRAYEAALADSRQYDFDDMIIETIHALESDESMLREVQESYQYLLADEHQDVNQSQNRILELIASYHEHPNIFVVGDEKQAIYRFQGASLENFLFFENSFGDTNTIALTKNYRSGQTILDVAHSLVEVAEGPLKDLRVPLTAAVPISDTVEERAFTHEAVEDDWLVRQVEEEIASGVSRNEIAVLVRTNREVAALTTRLRQAGIAVNPSADSDLLTHPVTAMLVHLITAVTSDVTEQALYCVVHGAYWQIPRADLVRVLCARRHDTPLSALLADPVLLKECGVTDPAPFLRVHEVLSSVRDRMVSQPPQRIVEYVVNESGFLDHLMVHDPVNGVRVLRRLYDEIESLVVSDPALDLTGLLAAIEKRRAYNLSLTAPFIADTADAVSVMTAHKAKGLEFQVVFAPHLVESVWGGGKKAEQIPVPNISRLKEEDIDPRDDERRLLYVVLTRAKQKLYLSFAATTVDGRTRARSSLLDELSSELVTQVSTDDMTDAFDATRGMGAVQIPSFDHAHIISLFAKKGFSAISFNHFLESPWEYVYKHLLRVPETKTESLQLGTAVHNVLERMARQYRTDGSRVEVAQLAPLLERELRQQPLDQMTFARLTSRGLEVLQAYHEHFYQELPADMWLEHKLTLMLPTGIAELPEIPLVGKLDRIDISEDGTALRVLDYKTGKPKTRGQIEGTTKDSEGNYKRQLVFYALLLSLGDDERIKTSTGTLSFVQPAQNGAIKEETFIITLDEVEELKQSIVEATKRLYDGSFMNEPCDPERCSYCHLVEQL